MGRGTRCFASLAPVLHLVMLACSPITADSAVRMDSSRKGFQKLPGFCEPKRNVRSPGSCVWLLTMKFVKQGLGNLLTELKLGKFPTRQCVEDVGIDEGEIQQVEKHYCIYTYLYCAMVLCIPLFLYVIHLRCAPGILLYITVHNLPLSWKTTKSHSCDHCNECLNLLDGFCLSLVMCSSFMRKVEML